jgi:maltooligosyltrehalose trehalohydrolase
MRRDDCGYFKVQVPGTQAGSRYLYELDGSIERPDPASRFQPEGVHGPSEVVDLESFPWTDQNWKAPPLTNSVFYELHIGTYTSSGTLRELTCHLPRISELGVTTVELMPVAQFPGARNWGYDGVYPYAVQNSYGGPIDLQRFVNAAHGIGLAVALDVVYNHLGPEGNYLGDFGPYFSSRYKTPWGEAINFDGPDSGPVRQFFIDNAIHWFENYHIDVLRLDAVHGIFDFSAFHFLADLQQQTGAAAKRLGRELTLIAESDLNDSRLLHSREQGGYELPAQWSDDFHHSVHTLLTNEHHGYYADFGHMEDLAVTLREGWRYSGQYSKFRRRRHGNSPRGVSPSHFVVFSQNHDQVGNRARGDRLSQLLDLEALKLAAGVTLLSPFVPLLFMGEEYGETSPFLYFTDHGDRNLQDAVRKGRREEFAEFGWQGEVPDPQDPHTFAKSKLKHDVDEGPHGMLREFYRRLIQFRRENQLGANADLGVTFDESQKTLAITRSGDARPTIMLFNFAGEVREYRAQVDAGHWFIPIYSAHSEWLGSVEALPQFDARASIALAPKSFLILQRATPSEGGL